MTDREKLTGLLTEFGVGFIEDGYDIRCQEGRAKIVGYSQFCTVFEFDETGAFLQMGAWE